MNIFVDSTIDDAERRRELYGGSVFVYSPSEATEKLCQFARELIEEAFYPVDPLKIHESMPADKCAAILAGLKPRFIHHQQSKQYIQQMLNEAGCDLENTYFDVPRLRTAFPGDYLKSGIAYAFHAHRDTWYSAPFCQINWWMPVYEVNSDNCMSLHPQYFDRAIKNGSNNYNYQRWNQESRFDAAKHIRQDTRVQPHATEPIDLDPQIRLVCKVGGVYLFSAAQLHSTVPNVSQVTRFSVDFRSLHFQDLCRHIGAPNLDSACTGTTIGDYLRGTDLANLPADLIALFQGDLQRDQAVTV
jgi:hypothetical protein